MPAACRAFNKSIRKCALSWSIHKNFALLLSCSLLSCHRENNNDTQAVHERLHGKYRAVSSISDEAIDANHDGVATNNLLAELPNIVNCDLEIRITDKFYIGTSWPEQYLVEGNGPIAVNYAA